MEIQLHEVHKKANWVKELLSSLGFFFFLIYLILVGLGYETLIQEYSPNHGYYLIANNYYCLLDILWFLKSLNAYEQPLIRMTKTNKTPQQ